MNGKERLYAVLGGIVGALVAMMISTLSPLTAQKDAFGDITCTSLKVVRPDGRSKVVLGANEESGYVTVVREDGRFTNVTGGMIGVFSDEDMDLQLYLGADEHGGMIYVYGKGDESSRVAIGVNKYGNGAVTTRDKHGYRQ